MDASLARAQQAVTRFGTAAVASNNAVAGSYTRLGSAQRNAAGVVVGGNARVVGSTRAVTSGLQAQQAQVTRLQGSWTRLATTAAAMAGGFTLARVLTDAVTEAVAFEAAMRNVNSLMQETDDVFFATSDAVLALSRDLPQTATVLAEGLYEITSSGFAGAEGLEVLEVAAKAATAGLTTTATAGQTITAVLNAYGRPAQDAADVSDALFATVDKGVITFEGLSLALGQTVGSAAAAGVPIEDLGAALATITKGGQNAELASTSLSNLLTKIVSPTEKMAALYKELGWESGEAALQQIGLAGVVKAVGDATGGSLSQIQALTGDMQATRALTGLLADDGKTYAEVQDQVGDANERRGATEKALAEQMKSASAQWQIFENRVQAAATSVGMRVLPVFTRFLTKAQELAGDALPGLRTGVARLKPLLDSLRAVGADVATVLGTLIQVAGPAAKALGGVAWWVAATALEKLGGVLEWVTGLLADHKGVVAAVAGVIGGIYLTRMALAIGAGVGMAATSVANSVAALRAGTGFGIMGAAAYGAAGGITAATVAAGGLAIVLTAGLAYGLYRSQKASKAATEEAEKLAEGFDAFDTSGPQESITALSDKVGKGAAELKEYADEGFGGFVAQALDFVFGTNKAVDGAEAAGAKLAELQDEWIATRGGINEAYRQTGTEIGRLEQIARDADIDVSTPEGVDELVAHVKEISSSLGVATEDTDAFMRNFSIGTEDLNTIVEEFADTVGQAFAGATDILGSWKPGEGVDELEAAQERLADANDRLVKQEEDIAAAEEVTTDMADALATAHTDVADATQGVADAQQAVKDGTLKSYYEREITEATKFADNLQKAAEMHLDPGALAKLMQAGPEQAGPILEQLVADTSGALIAQVNAAEKTLAGLNARIVADARLTQKAISANSDRLARDLAVAMDINAELFASGFASTPAQIAEALGIAEPEVHRIMDEFGIDKGGVIAAGIGKGLAAGVPVAMKALTDFTGAVAKDPFGNPQYGTPGTKPKASAEGGRIYGPGGPKQDIIPALLSAGEWVQPAASVQFYGEGFMEAVRRRRFPRPPGLAEGGLVGVAAWAPPPPSAVRVVEVMSTHTTRTDRPIHVDQVVTSDVSDFIRQAERTRRRRQLDRVTG